MGTSETEGEIRNHFAFFHTDSMVSRSLRFVLASFCFLGHLMGQGAVLNGTIKEAHAHNTSFINKRFGLFTRCQPMHLHVEAQDMVGDSASTYPYKLIPNEKWQKAIRELVERRLRTARLYQETAQNYFYVSVQLQQPYKNYKLAFDFRKMLYDPSTDSWDHATTYGADNIDLPTEHNLMSTLSFFLDKFLEDYVEENKAFCH